MFLKKVKSRILRTKELYYVTRKEDDCGSEIIINSFLQQPFSFGPSSILYFNTSLFIKAST